MAIPAWCLFGYAYATSYTAASPLSKELLGVPYRCRHQKNASSARIIL